MSIFDYITAFAVGGGLCVIAQVLIDKTALTPCKILVLYVTSGVVFTGCGLYGRLVDAAGCGATVPLTGFGYVIATGVRSAVEKNGIIGALTGGLSAASAGITAALVFGYIVAVIFRGKPK